MLCRLPQAIALSGASGCDGVVSMGGGSVIDTGKAVAALLTNGGRPIDYMEVIGAGKSMTEPAQPFIAIPTTSGTGAEVTPFAVITDDTNPAALRKYPIADYALTPEMAIIDPQLASSMPRGLTASTGLDALTHALESYVSVFCTDYTAGLSLQVRFK